MESKSSKPLSNIKEGLCPHCKTSLNFSDEDREEGAKISCPKCEENFLIMEAKSSKGKGGCLKTGLYIFIGLVVLSILLAYPWFVLGLLGGWLIFKFYKPSEGKRGWKTVLIIGVVLLGFILNIGLATDLDSDSPPSQFAKYEEIEEKKSKAMDLLEEAKVKLEEEDVQETFYLLNEAIKIHPSESFNEAIFMKKDLSQAESEEFLKESLGGLTDEEFNLLTEGNLNKEFLKDEVVNRYFIKVLVRNKDKRAEYYAQIQEERAVEEAARAEEERLKAEKERAEKIRSHFSVWDGSHIELKSYVKNTLNDPKSFEHVETLYSDKGDYLVVQMKFRGKNAFGGVVLNSVTAHVLTEEPSIFEIIDYSY